MHTEYDIILFDLDGTLTDPKLGITKSVQYALKHFGIVEENLSCLEKFIGPPLKESFKEYYNFGEQDIEIAIKEYREYFADRGIFENIVYPSVPEVLEELRKSGKKLMVATSKPTIFAERILKHFNLCEYFTFVSGSNLDGSRCRKSEVIAYGLSQNAILEKSKVIMIGDRRHDIIGAREIGIDAVGVLYGYGSREELERENPKFIVDTVIDLRSLFI